MVDFKRLNRDRGNARPSFAYKARSTQAANERLNRYNTGNRDTFVPADLEVWQPKEGDNWIRLLHPPWEGAEHYAYDLYIHYEVGPDKNTYLCVEKMKGQECELCNELRKAQASGDTEYARALESSLRLAAWIIDREDEKKGVQLWLYAPSIDREILEQARDRRTGEILMVDHPEEGFDIEFVRKGKGMLTKYTGVKLARQPSAVEPKWLQFITEKPLDSIWKFYDNEHIMTAFGGAPKEGGEKPHETTQTRSDEPPPKEEPVARRRPSAEPEPQDEKPAPASNNRRRLAALDAQQAKKPKVAFSKMTINQLLDYADEHNILIPDNIPDEGIAEFLEEESIPF